MTQIRPGKIYKQSPPKFESYLIPYPDNPQLYIWQKVERIIIGNTATQVCLRAEFVEWRAAHNMDCFLNDLTGILKEFILPLPWHSIRNTIPQMPSKELAQNRRLTGTQEEPAMYLIVDITRFRYQDFQIICGDDTSSVSKNTSPFTSKLHPKTISLIIQATHHYSLV